MITFDVALDQLTAIVAERPDHVYSNPEGISPTPTSPRCLYVHNKARPTELTSGCIIGEWLHRFGGMALADINNLDGLGNAYVVLKRLGLWMTPKARVLLYEMQKEQDAGKAWQRALLLAVTRTRWEIPGEFDAPDPDSWNAEDE